MIFNIVYFCTAIPTGYVVARGTWNDPGVQEAFHGPWESLLIPILCGVGFGLVWPIVWAFVACCFIVDKVNPTSVGSKILGPRRRNIALKNRIKELERELDIG